uniref:NADH dehydrogenase subunit 4L n=2 Tax=Brachionus calyciflorus TaxID=104777 RepID=A0A1Q1MMF2_9BILA|nr:NADH dehydrogenase subunit 4L [Brachionus calyciflorus]UBY46737.1 NADH dehydrogenase subunit 4L [Brachionus calyciflorus]
MLYLLLILCLIFLYHSNNLLLSLLVLEMLGFLMLFYVSSNLSIIFDSDFMILVLFSIFVMEGVIALSGLIMLVSFSGSDYVSSSSLSKL